MRTNYVSANHRSVRKCNVVVELREVRKDCAKTKRVLRIFLVAYCLLGVCYYAVLLSK